MTRAIAASSPSEVQLTPKQARAESKLIAMACVAMVLIGGILQLFFPAGPVGMVLYTALMSLALVTTAYVVRGRLLDMFAGFRMAAVVLSILGIGAAAGTLILQQKPAEFYRMQYGGLGALIVGLHIDDIFHTLWFGSLVAMMNAGLIVSAGRRWPVTRRNVGFFMVHLGIIVTLAGAGVSSVFSVKGRIDLHVGEAAQTVRVTHSGLGGPAELPLNASVQLVKFDVDHYADQPRISLYLPAKKGSGYELKTTFENEVGAKYRLPDGNSFRIKAYYPDLVMTEKLVETGGTLAALKLVVDGKETFLIPEERPRADSRDGSVAVLFGWQRPAAKIDAPLHTVKGAKGEAVPVRLGETVTVEGTQLKALRFFPHFTYDLKAQQAMNVSDTPVNPALEIEVAGVKRWLFANMPGFGHGEGAIPLSYAFSPEGGTAAGTVIAVGGADKTMVLRKPDGTEETLPFKEGLEVGPVKLGALLEKASVVREPATASQEVKQAAVMIELTKEGITREKFMAAHQMEPVDVGRGYLAFETHIEDVKAFRSEVLVSTSPGAATRSIVEVNDPLRVGPWKLYQVNYDPKDPNYSGLEAVRDPGVNWVFVGFGLLFFGVFYTMYVGPRMRHREA